MWKQCHVKTTHFPGNGIYIYIPPMLQWWLGDGADGIVLTKKRVLISSNPDFFVKHHSHHFLTHHLRALHSKTLVSHQKNMASLVLYSFYLIFRCTEKSLQLVSLALNPCCVDPGCSHVSPDQISQFIPAGHGNPAGKAEASPKERDQRRVAGRGGLGSAVVKSVHIIQRSWECGGGSSYIYIYMYNIHIYIYIYIPYGSKHCLRRYILKP